MLVLPPALSPLAAYPQFITYRLSPSRTRPGKTDKLPVDPRSGALRDAHDVSLWMPFEAAAQAAASAQERVGLPHGVGFVFTPKDPFWFLDVDHAYDPATGWNAISTQLMQDLAGCAVEVSSSNRGLHFFGTGEPPAHGTRNGDLGLEFYHEKRFVALTGTNTTGSAAFAPRALAEVVTRYFPKVNPASLGGDWWSDQPVAAWHGPTNDERLVERALLSSSVGGVFGGKARFVDLWTGDTAVLERTYPGDSEADQALAQHLAFWTGNDASRIERLMRQSALVRDKWDRPGDDYLRRTIRKACAMQEEFLSDAPLPESPMQATGSELVDHAARTTHRTLLQPEEQIAYFAGCCYVRDEHGVMLPDGAVVDQGRFNALYGGRTFVMDDGNSRTVRKAFEVFTESQSVRFPRADTTCFRPDLPPGKVIREGGRTQVNVWVPVAVERHAGDAGRFWDHLARMFPVERDRLLLMGYLCTVVQHQGHKLQWAPLIQGTTGNGKSMLSRFVREAIGERYCHSPRAKSLDSEFNAWQERHTFYNVDEIYIPEKRIDVLETLKQMISDDGGVEVTRKGVDSATRRTCGNFTFNTNHRAAMRKDRHDRRIAPFYSAQQQPSDLERDGLTKAYFSDYVDWLKGQGEYADQGFTGYSVVSDLLWTWRVPAEFDARKDVRAPITSSTEMAIHENFGLVEEEVLEAVEQGAVGFRGGWISSKFLKDLGRSVDRSIKRDRMREMMESLGFTPHPNLPGGRTVNLVSIPDGGRPVLYVRKDRVDLLSLTKSGEIAEAYAKAQKD